MAKKLILSITITLLAFMGTTFAHDCGLVVGMDLSGIKYDTILPSPEYKTTIEQAFINLKAYCCLQKNISCSDAEKAILPKSNYPKSPYFFDHLFDITMRRLDGVQSLAYGLEPDPTGKKWREYTDAVAKNPNGVQAKTIQETYKEYRTLHPEATKNLNTVAKNFFEINNETLSLADKYSKVCPLMKWLYEKIQSEPTIIWTKFETNSFFKKCDNLVNKRVSQESAYVKILMTKKSTQLLNETMKAYTKTYFVEDKLMDLWTLVNKVKDSFQTIVQQAAASKSCTTK